MLCKKQSSFYHFNNRDKSQIDYFVENNLRVKKYWTFEREFTNLSTHDPIIVTVKRMSFSVIILKYFFEANILNIYDLNTILNYLFSKLLSFYCIFDIQNL
jgi:hypothetical protein